MRNLKYLCYKRFNELYLLFLFMLLSIVLLMVRMKVHQEFFFIFLVWNLFLAAIPYGITFYMMSRKPQHKFKILIAFLVWLAFLPNAPYIITDLVHLRMSDGNSIWLDLLVVLSFAISGMAFYLLSLRDMTTMLKAILPERIMHYFLPFIAAITGFGIYLGRFLRYNSWEIIQNPFALSKDVINILLHPNQNIGAWFFTIAFSSFLYIIYLIFSKTPELNEISDF